ncbi:MAG: carboxypeptidase regulatory-like domain-containing protein [Muribaculaceae bacterium]|nr:carboxypeptidase regulatory-like domain-containing protein [Muribaculaceae bacterium]
MKKSLLFGAMALVASASLTAKDADQLRVYINPGHGSWTGNDRPCQLVGHGAYNVNDPDTTNFFETNTNLRKGYGVLEKLRQMGLKFDPTLNQTGELHQIGAARDLSNNIVMSHVKAGPHEGDYRTTGQLNSAKGAIYEKYSEGKTYEKLTADEKAEIETKFTDQEKDEIAALDHLLSRAELFNRALSEIDAEVDANNFDMFISIHSNAATEGTTTNFPLYLYRGYDAGKGGPKVENSDVMAQKCWPHSFANPHMVWTSYSATSTNIRGDLNFYSTTSTYGYLGVLKHETPGFLVEGYFHTYQPARQRAMNWDVDYMEGYAYARGIADYFGLEDKTGSIYGVVRDLHEKFVHDQYKPNGASDDLYLPLNGAKVVLKKGDETIAEYTTDDNYNGAYVFRDVDPGKYTVVITHPDYKEIEPMEVEVKAGETTYPVSKMENTEYEPPKINYVTYPDEFNLASQGPQSTYNFTDKFKDVEIEALAGKNIKRSIARGENIYILALDEEGKATVLVYDVKNNAVLREIGTEGTEGDFLPLSDIALTAEGVLVGINKTNQKFGGTKQVHIYKWTNNAEDGIAEGNPEVWFSTNNGGNFNDGITGETMAYAGTLDEGRLIYSAVTAAESTNLRFANVTIANGDMASAYHMNHNSNPNGNEIALGNYQINISPAADNQFIINSTLVPATEYICAAAAAGVPTPVASLNAEVTSAAYKSQMFKYAGHSYMVVPTVEEVTEQAEGDEETPEAPKAVGVKLLDITEGLDKAVEVGAAGVTFTPAEFEGLATMGQTIVTRDVEDNVTAGHMNLYVASANGVSHFTTKNVKQPVYKTEFAYGLKSTKNDDETYTIEYSLSGDAVSAELVLTDVDDQQIIPLEATKGAHTYTLDTNDLDNGKTYTWEVKVTSKSNGVSGEIFAEKHGLSDRRGGVVAITDPAVESFGYTVVSHGNAGGMDIYNPAGEKVGERLWKDHALFGGVNGANNQSNPFRGHEREGKVVLPSWGDKAHGIVVIDPLAVEEPASMYTGQMQSSGNFIYNEASLGGGHAGLCFVGKGEDTKLYAFSEDHDAATKNSVVRYDIGSSWVITEAPEVMGHKALLANTNVDMLGYGEGYFVSQIRTAGNNTKGCPCFAYIDANTNEDVYQSSENSDDISNGISGMAITPDGKIFAHAESNKIDIFNVVWDGNKPTFTLASTIPFAKTLGWAHMRFDAAGNLHVYERENGGYHVYAVARQNPAVTTPGISEIVTGESGVEIIEETLNDGPVEFWNLQGVKVNSDNLTPGIYIRRQGQKAEKVVIR